MRAALLEAEGGPLVLADDIEIARPRTGEVKVNVSHCGLCHSDLSAMTGAWPCPTPAILGHEAAGVVSEIGEGVTAVAEGDKVVLTPSPPCGRCYFCVRGEHSICTNTSAVATATLPDGGTRLTRGGETVYRGLGVGALGAEVIALEAGVVPVRADTPLETACVIGCAVQTGVGAVLNVAEVPEGATVLVTGLGGVGLSVVQGAVVAGAARIIVSDPVAARREAALGFGATDALDPDEAIDLPTVVRDLTDGIGVDYAFEAAGVAAIIETAIEATRAGGTTVCVGAPSLDVSITIPMAAAFVASARTVKGCFLGGSNSHRDIPRLLDLWRAGRVDLEGLITARRPLAEVNEGFDDLRAAKGIRTVIEL